MDQGTSMSDHEESDKMGEANKPDDQQTGLTPISPAGILARRVGWRMELVTRLLKEEPTTHWLTAEQVSLIAGTLREFEGIECAWCPPGQFVMGSPEHEDGRNEWETQHVVTLEQGFWMSSSPTTQAQYESIMGSNPSGFKEPDRPVEGVKWQDAVDYCRKLTVQHRGNGTLKEGWEWRLPTEAEWEYAARAGSLGPRHGELDEIAWYEANSGGETHPVKQKAPNGWGLYDTLGNVWEWCWNTWADNPFIQTYLDQEGCPLLTPEQKAENFKRIEENKNEVKRILYSFGFSGKEHILLAEKLTSKPPKEWFDRIIVDKKNEVREEHLKTLRKLIKDVSGIDQQVDELWRELHEKASKTKREKVLAEFKKLDDKLQKSFPKFYYKQKVIEEMFLLAENIHEKFQTSVRSIKELDAHKRSAQARATIHAEERRIKALEEFVRMSFADFDTAMSQLKLLEEEYYKLRRENRYCQFRVIRGGGWATDAVRVRSANREGTSDRSMQIGFRPVLSTSANRY
jgi:formylglycine-generating enzyme required for sulfatase activity